VLLLQARLLENAVDRPWREVVRWLPGYAL